MPGRRGDQGVAVDPGVGRNEARARPSWPPWATSRHPTLVSRAFVAITPIVVLPIPDAGRRPAPDRTAMAPSRRGRSRRTRSPRPARRPRGRRGARWPSRARRAGRARGPATCPRWPRCRRRRARSRPARRSRRRTRRSPGPAPGRTDRSPTSEVEQRQGGDDRHRPGAGREADAPLLAAPHHPVGGREPERRPAGQEHRVDAVDQAFGRQQVELPGGRRAAPHLARRHRVRPGTARPCTRCGPPRSVQCPTRTPATSVITEVAPRPRPVNWATSIARVMAGSRRTKLVDQLGQLVGTLLHELVAGARQHVQLASPSEARRGGGRAGPG